MPKDNDWGHTLPVGTIICDNEYPEDIGIIIERNIRGAYRVYAITFGGTQQGMRYQSNTNRLDWYDRGYIEDNCSVVVEATPYDKKKRKKTNDSKEERDKDKSRVSNKR